MLTIIHFVQIDSALSLFLLAVIGWVTSHSHVWCGQTNYSSLESHYVWCEAITIKKKLGYIFEESYSDW